MPGEEQTATATGPLTQKELAPAPAVGATIRDRYELRAVVGRGAQGTVFRAWDRVCGEEVALKLLHGEARRGLDALAHELRCARAIDHPNVCLVHDIVADGDHAFLVMQLATGPLDLKRSAARARPLSARLSDARDICAGLAAIHGAGLLHGDLKPGNVLRMPDGRLAVSDFGLARPLDATITTSAAGTPGYIAPEIAFGEPRTTASDVWSLGVVLHELLLGTRPPGRAPRGTPRALAALCAECLAPDPRARPDASTIARRLAEPAARRSPRPRAAWALLAVCAAVAGALIVVARRPGRVPELRAKASFPIANGVRCLETLPGGRAVRVITGRPTAAFDLDLVTGRHQPLQLVPEALDGPCPRLSPDGRTLAFARRSFTVMLGAADGSRARPLTTGTLAEWLPDGQALFVKIDQRNVGIARLDGSMTMLPQSPSPRIAILAIAVAATGQVAVLSQSAPLQHQLDTYDARTGALLRSTTLPIFTNALWYDARAQSFEVAVRDQHGWDYTAVAVTSEGRLVPRVRAPDGALGPGTSTALGLLLDTRARGSASLYRKSPDGHEELVLDGGGGYNPTVSDDGEVLATDYLPDGRTVIGVVSRGRLVRLTDGPRDWRPTFVQGRRDFLYVDLARNAIRRCAWTGAEAVHCREVAVDPGGIQSARESPDGRWIAYTTGLKASMRLGLVAAAGGPVRDLGPILDTPCTIYWSSNHAVWIGSAETRTLIELDVGTQPARETGRRIKDTAAGTGCPRPPPPDGHPPARYTVRIVFHEGQDMLVLSAI